MKQRIIAYDILKSLSIFLVCLYHYGTLDLDIVNHASATSYFQYFFQAISSIGVPLFFMVNGALLLNKPFQFRRHIQKTLTIAALFVVWGAITLAIGVAKYHDHYSFKSFIKALYYTGEGRTNHLWFLAAMIYIYLLFPVIKAIFDKNNNGWIGYLFALIFVCTFGNVLVTEITNIGGFIFHKPSLQSKVIQNIPWFNPFNVYFSYALCYFIAGGWIARSNSKIIISKRNLGFVFFAAWLLLFAFGVMKSKISNEVFDIVWNGYDTIMTFAMSVALFLICSRINFLHDWLSKSVINISHNTLGIYFIHVPLGIIFTSYYEQLPFSNFFISDLLYVFFIISLSLFISIVMRNIPLIRELVKI